MYTDTKTPLDLPLLLLLSLSLNLLLQLAIRLTLKLIRTTNSNILRTEVTEEVLKHVLNEPATTVIEDHEHGESHLKLVRERNETELLVEFGDELCRAGECYTGSGNQTPVHGLVLANGFTERTALIVDREGGNLLDQLEEVDGAVQEGRLELALEVDVGVSSVDCVSTEVKWIQKSVGTYGSCL